MASSSFDISGLSELSSVSIDAEDVQTRTATASRPGARPGTTVGRVPASTPSMGRPQTAVRRESTQSIELSGSDISGSIEMDETPLTRMPSHRPTTSGKPPLAPGRMQPQPAQAASMSSLDFSGSDLSGSIEMGKDSSSQLLTTRATSASRPITSGKPPPVPGRPSAPSANWGGPARRGTAAGSSHNRSDSFSLSAGSDDLSADLDISGDGDPAPYGSRPQGTTAEVLSLDGPKATQTRMTRAGSAQQTIRESTHTVELSGPESLDLSGSLEIEHSEEPPSRVSQQRGPFTAKPSPPPQQQQPSRYLQDSGSISTITFSDSDIEQSLSVVEGGGAPSGARAVAGAAANRGSGGGRAAAAAPEVKSLSLSYDATVLQEGSSGGEFGESASIDYGESGGVMRRPGSASRDRPPVGLAPPPSYQRRTITPSLSGSTFDSDSVSDNSLRRNPTAASASRAPKPDSPTRRPGSSRPSRPQSVSGLTAEPVFASGSSRSGGGTPSLHSAGSSLHSAGGEGSRRGGGRRRMGGETVQDVSELLAASAALAGLSYDTYGSAATETQESRGDGGGGAAIDSISIASTNSWDKTGDSGSGRSRGTSRGAGRSAAGSSRMGRRSDGSEDKVGAEVILSASSLESSGEAFRRPTAPQGSGGMVAGVRSGSGGRRLGHSGGVSSPGSIGGGGRSSSESSYAVGGVRLRAMDELETSGAGGTEQPSQLSGASYDVSYDNESERQPSALTQTQRGGALPQGSDGGGSGSRGREVVRYDAPSTDSSLADFRPPGLSTSRLSTSGGAIDRTVGVGSSTSSSTTTSSSSSSSTSTRSSGTGSRGHSGSGSGSGSRSSGSREGDRSRDSSSGSGPGVGTGFEDDPLAGLQVVREASEDSSSSGENIMTLDQLHSVKAVAAEEAEVAMEQASSKRSSRSSGSRGGRSQRGAVQPSPPPPQEPAAGGSRDSNLEDEDAEKYEYEDDFTTESVATESVPASRVLSRAGSSLRAESMRRRAGHVLAHPQEFSFSHQVGAAAAMQRDLPGTIVERSSDERSAASSTSGGSRRGGAAAKLPPRGGEDARTVPRPPPPAAAAAASVPPLPRTAAGPFPDPRLTGPAGAISGSYSYSSVEEDEELMSSAVRSPRGAGSSWPRPSGSEQSSPSLSRRERRRHTQDVGSPSGDYDASASRSHLSQSGALGATPVAPGWATSGIQRGTGAAADPYQYSRDSDLSEEFIPSQAMQRALTEQPIFRPLMPNVPTPRVSTGAPITVPAFTARGVPSPDPRASDPAAADAAATPAHHDTQPSQHYHQQNNQKQQQQQPQQQQRQVPPPEPLSPAVAAAAAPPPPRYEYAATQTDVYTHVVDLDPIPRPGTVKLRTVAMQWGTLNEAATQVAYDPVAKQLVEASSHSHSGEGPGEGLAGSMPPHLRHQLHHHLLQQQQLYGAFTKRGGAGGWPSSLLQAGAHSVLGEVSPLSGIGPGFGILSLAFHSVKTAAMLEQLERSLSSAATSAGLAPLPAYPLPLAMHGASPVPPPYYPYGAPHPQGWWPPPHPQQPAQTAGQAAAAAYAAATAVAPAAQPPPAPGPPSPAGAASAGTAPAAAAAAGTGAPERSVAWPTLTTVISSAVSPSRSASPLPVSPPSRLRAVSITAPLSDGNSSSAVLNDRQARAAGTAAAAAAAVAAHDAEVAAARRRSHLSSVSSLGAAGYGSGTRQVSGSRSMSPGGPHYARSARSRPSDGSVYTEDFEEAEEIVEEESGAVGSVHGSGGGAGRDTTGLDASGLESSVPEEEEEVEEAVEESIPEESNGSGTSTAEYSDDFEPDNIPVLRSTASILTRSLTMGSGSRSKFIPALSSNSFSGRSLLRRGSVVVPTLAPISGSEPASKDDDEDSPSLGSRVLNRVGSIIKSSSGFKRTASISITMADDPMLPNQMARILPTHSFAGTPAAQHSARHPSVDESPRDKHHAGPAAAVGAAAAADSGGQAQAGHPPPGAAAGEQPAGPAGAPPPWMYPPYYPYAPYSPYMPHPYGAPYGAPYPPPQAFPPAATAAPHAASVLQYLPQPIPVPSGMYFYPPAPPPHYPAAAPVQGAAGSPYPHPAAAGGAAAAAVATAARPHGVLVPPGDHLHHHNHLNNMHVTFADGSGPGRDHLQAGPAAHRSPGEAAAAAGQPSGAVRTAPVPAPGSTTGPAHPPPGMPPAAYQQQQPALGAGFGYGHVAPKPGSLFGIGGGGFGVGSSPLFTAQSTLQRFSSVLKSGAYPGLDPMTVHTIRTDLIKTAAAVSSQIGYEDIVAEQGATDEYRAQLARVRARLAAARASLPSVIPNQDKVVLVRTAMSPGQPPLQSPSLAAAAAAIQAQAHASSGGGVGVGGLGAGSRVLAISTPAPGSYRYTTLEDTRRLIDATRPYAAVGAN